MTVDYHKFWLQSIHSYSDTKTPVILIGTHDDKLSKAVSLINYERNWHFALLLKALVTICPACLVTVHMLLISPVELYIYKVIETATQDKRTVVLLAVDIRYKFV